MATAKSTGGTTEGYRPGIGVDYSGREAIDPTKNVESLVKALEDTMEKLRQADGRRLDDLRQADAKRIADLRDADSDRLDDLRDADKTRLSELAAMKREYDKQIFDIQTVQVKTTSDLISAQLSKETGSLANQINAATLQTQGLIQTLSARIDKLEQSRYEISGKTSVADPQLASTLAALGSGITAMQDAMPRAIAKMAETNADAIDKLSMSLQKVERSELGVVARGMGRGEIVSYITMGILVLSQVIVMVAVFLPHANQLPH